MATTTQKHFSMALPAWSLSTKLKTFGSRVMDVLVLIANSSSIAKEIEHLNMKSDAELEAKGTSRVDEIQRIFGPRMFL